jgi:hypothetical protein
MLKLEILPLIGLQVGLLVGWSVTKTSERYEMQSAMKTWKYWFVSKENNIEKKGRYISHRPTFWKQNQKQNQYLMDNTIRPI